MKVLCWKKPVVGVAVQSRRAAAPQLGQFLLPQPAPKFSVAEQLVQKNEETPSSPVPQAMILLKIRRTHESCVLSRDGSRLKRSAIRPTIGSPGVVKIFKDRVDFSTYGK